MDAPKTREFAEAVEKLVGGNTALLLVPASKGEFENVVLSAKNLSSLKVLNANYLNVRDLLGYDKIVLPVEAIDVISGYLG